MRNSKVLNILRRWSFWFLDFLKGSHIRKKYKNLFDVEKLDIDSKDYREYEKKQMNKILKQARENTAFYSKFNKYEEFPIITKKQINENYNDFISKKYKNKKLYKMSTSGSTGEPFTILQNKQKKKAVNAEILFYSRKAKYKVGNNLFFPRSLNSKTKKSNLVQFIQNETLVDVSDVSYDNILATIKMLEEKNQKNTMILSYGSTYEVIAKYYEDNLLPQINTVVGIVSSAVYLKDETRNTIEDMFGCRVFSRYSNQENGVLGQDFDENNVFIINDANYKIEIYDLYKDQLVEDGEIGRIIVTDYFNYAMPMIKYDTGDIGAIKTIVHKGVKKKAIYKFEGRKIDFIFNTKGNRISPHVISTTFAEFDSIKKYQFIQKSSHNYEIKIVISEKINENSVLDRFKGILGKDANIIINLVDDIPIEKSGKYRYILNLTNEK